MKKLQTTTQKKKTSATSAVTISFLWPPRAQCLALFPFKSKGEQDYSDIKEICTDFPHIL